MIKLTWEEIVETCSRIHTTRRRELIPGNPNLMREDSRAIDILYGGQEGRIVPTRMHEPGFYWWLNDVPRRSERDLAHLKDAVDNGEVYLKTT